MLYNEIQKHLNTLKEKFNSRKKELQVQPKPKLN